MAEIEVKPVSYQDTKPFILNIHYARRMPCVQYAFGWGSTALGFGGYGGQMMTTARTYIIVHINRAYVYFGGRYAYEVPYPFNKAFEDDMAKHSLASVVASQKYWRTDGD